jgi:hypothetical protein
MSRSSMSVAEQHVSGRTRPAGLPLTSPPDPDRTRRTRRTAGPLRRERRPHGPGSAQGPAGLPPREARLPSDATLHASRSCLECTSCEGSGPGPDSQRRSVSQPADVAPWAPRTRLIYCPGLWRRGAGWCRPRRTAPSLRRSRLPFVRIMPVIRYRFRAAGEVEARSGGCVRPARRGQCMWRERRDQFVSVTRRTGCPVTAATVRKSRSSVRTVRR